MSRNNFSGTEVKNYWWNQFSKPFVLAGPCSAESPTQMREVVQKLAASNIPFIRAGIWKPRTRPGSFEGVGAEALPWLVELKKEFNVKFAIEVANPHHVELALKYGIDLLWLGARTTVNPFAVQEIADSLVGVDIPVLVKNPINPDLALWLGAIERIEKAGISRTGAIHRGFSSLQQSKYRNIPLWQIPLELKSLRTDLPLICDPSHITGNRDLIANVSQKAMDLNYDGLIIETHPNPPEALSDAAQQITPEALIDLLGKLKMRDSSFRNSFSINRLEEIRHQIDNADQEILEAIARRMRLVEEIGHYKKDNNVAIFQLERWKEVFKSRPEWGDAMNLDKEFILDIYRQIHQASIKSQTEIFNGNGEQDG